MRIVVTGACGMLGTELLILLADTHEVFALDMRVPTLAVPGVSYQSLDVTDTKKTYEFISRLNPELVIHTAAETNVDNSEHNSERVFCINALGTRNVALACQRFDAGLMYISTDYVFDGQKREPYKEIEQPHPLNTYGWSKYWGELYVQWLVRRFYIVRSSWLFGAYGRNFVEAILSQVRSNHELKVVDDQLGSPTYAVDLAQALVQLVSSHKETGTGLYGLWHITNSGSCSWYEFAQEILRLSGHPQRIGRATSQEIKRPAVRPGYSVLDNFNWRLHGFSALPRWSDALKRYFNEGPALSKSNLE